LSRLLVNILMTMDCESANVDVSDHGISMSSSGPADYAESERSIRGFVEIVEAAGYPATLFLHPEVAIAHADLVREMHASDTCLGLHLHPYKLADSAYPEDQQRGILKRAIEAWENALGERPQYFRAGYFSANDCTFRILEELGFRGGSLSSPGRLLPSHFSVWRDAVPYPHRAHRAFRLVAGDSDFIEVPVAVAYGRPVARGHAGEQGYEWPYIPHTYDHAAVVSDILKRFNKDQPQFGTLVTDTHNDHDYSNPQSAASINLRCILDAIDASCETLGLEPKGTTIDALCDRVREESP
jgi:peptidoglycan/xylan/chitin deacetylase (PgdA/CDA1 family)